MDLSKDGGEEKNYAFRKSKLSKISQHEYIKVNKQTGEYIFISTPHPPDETNFNS